MNVTVTLELFQPWAFGAGEAEAVIEGGITTVNGAPLLETPLTVTTTLPLEAPLGTDVVIEVAFQPVAVAVVPLNLIVLVPWLVPKFVPVIVTVLPAKPAEEERLVIDGVGITVNDKPLLARLFTVTTTFPVPAPLGTGTTIVVLDQLVGVAGVPLKATVLDPCVDPKLAPEIVMEVPLGPEVGDRLERDGGVLTVNDDPLLARPLTVTITFPVVAVLGTCTTIDVALQLLGAAATPLKVTVLVP